jgi:tripartite-type tricarboxylate transporter receptor subunit TctC
VEDIMHQYGGRGELARRSLLAIGAGFLLTIVDARAESFPNGPVKIVTSVGPGATPDIISRLVADHLTQLWGQQVIVLNQPGGAGAVAIKAVAPATADGHTLYMALASNFIALPELQKNFPVDLVRDFVPIGFVGEQPLGIGVTPALGVNTLSELIALLKSEPDALNVAAGNRGSILHLAGEWLRSATGTKFTMLHYTGGARALPDVLSGRVQVDIDGLASMRGAIDGGQLKLLAVTTDKRIHNFPQVPAVAETLPGFRAVGWMALMAPPGTPAGVALKISDDLRKVLVSSELGKRLDELGTYANPTTPAELTNFIREQQQIWRPVISETAKTIR